MSSNSTNATSPTSSPPATNSSSSSNSTASAQAPTTATPASPPPPSSTPPPPPPPTSTQSPTSSPSRTQSSPPPPPPPPKSSSSQLSSPPPPPSSASTSTNSNTTSGSSDNSSNLVLPVILGVAGGIVMMLLVSWLLNLCCSRKKKKIDKPHNHMQYYNDTSGFQGGNYFMSGPDSQWQTESNIGRPPVPVSGSSGGGDSAWHPPDMNSAAYSGPHVPPMPPPSPTVALGFNKSTFTYEELAVATNNFSQANLLGQGGFGYVYKGVLSNGKEIAAKQLKSGSGQGEREFQAEVDIISRVHHRHLVSLVGYCIAGTQRMLVYEFVENKTLEYHLHGASKGLPVMNWPTRLKIALGSAKGLAYLHEDCHPRIIHRDIKSANILLDNKFEAMVADFGLAKLTTDNNTHVSTRVMGTFGYLAPEYASSGKLTEKSDVFSYGIMLLEIITGRRPVDTSHYMDDSLVDWARPVLSRSLADGNYDELADLRLQGNYDPMEMARMVACAAASVRHSARRRPKMSQIVRALEGDVSLEDLNEGMRPGQSMMFSSSSDYDSSSYNNNMHRMRKMALPSPEIEYSADYSDEYKPRHSDSSSDAAFPDDLNPRHRGHPDF